MSIDRENLMRKQLFRPGLESEIASFLLETERATSRYTTEAFDESLCKQIVESQQFID